MDRDTTSLTRRIAPAGGRWWQIATRWGAYVEYLDALIASLGTMEQPGLGTVRLDESYVPVRVRTCAVVDELGGPGSGYGSTTLPDALQESPRLLLIGPAGTGKSALLRRYATLVARDVVEGGRRAVLADGAPWLPVYLKLDGDPADGVPLQTSLAAAMTAVGFDGASDFLAAHLAAGRVVVLLDDLDTLSAGARRAAAAQIADLVRERPGNRFVVATRDIADMKWFPEFAAFEVVGTDPRRLEGLASHWGYGHQASTAALLRVIERFPLVASVAARPGWFALLLADTAQLAGGDAREARVNGASRTGRVRERESEGAHRSANEVLAGFVSQLDPQDPDVWSPLAVDMYEQRTTLGRAAEIPAGRRLSGLLQWLDDDNWRFVHRAVQAYFAAQAMSHDPEAVIALLAHAEDPWWRPVLILAASLLDDPAPVVDELLTSGRAAEAALVLAELRVPPEAQRTLALDTLLAGVGPETEDDDQDLAALAALLRSEDVRSSGGAVGPVLAALADPVAELRCAAADSLGRLGNAAAIAPLLTALGDTDPQVREAASEALAAYGERTVQPLVRQLSVANDVVRAAAVHALARQGAPAVAALLTLLDASSATLRAEASSALAEVGPPAIPALVGVLAGPDGTAENPEARRDAAAAALTRIGGAAAVALIPLLAEATPAQRARIAEVMAAVGPSAVAALGAVLADETSPHSAAAAAVLGELDNAGPEGAACLARALADTRFDVRYEVRRALRMQGDVAKDTLLESLADPDEAVSWEAAQLLLDLPEPPIDQLIGKLTAMLGSDDAAERRKAVRALGSLGGPRVRGILEDTLADPDAVVRRSTLGELGRIGDPGAVPALAARWPDEDDTDAQLALLDALTELAPAEALPTLIDGLAAADANVRRHAAQLLARAGEPAVIPLVVELNHRPAEIDVENALYVLEEVASATRTGGHAPANLARAYYRMLVETLDIEELVYVAATLEWWPPAQELHRTFSSLKEFLEYRTLAGIGNAERSLEWVDHQETWLRPAAGRALRQLRSISQAVQYYNRGSRRRSKEKGLLAAADRLNQLRAMIGDLGPPHAAVFKTVADHWSERVNEAIRQLQGKAELELDVRTDNIRIRDVETTAVLVFELVNEGEGLASNIQLSLEAAPEEYELLSTSMHYLPPLGQGDRVTTEFTIRRGGEGVVPVAVLATYDDPQVEGQSRRFVREVRFFVEEAPYRDIGTSPYIAGPPVKTPAMFYGREATFEWVQENLSGTFQDNVLVLYGERRTGKTSVLYQLPFRLPDTYAFVLTDLQSIAYSLGSTSDLLYAMARKLVGGLRKQDFDLPKVEREEFAEHPIERFVDLGEQVGDMAIASGRRSVLIVDEFDLLIEAVERGNVSPFVFDCIRGLMQHQDGLSFIFAGAHQLSAMLKNPQSILFNTALRRKVSFLQKEEAERLIREPVKDLLWFEELAVEKILRVTAGQPYFIQYICHEIVNLARHDSRNFVTLRDVDRALQTTVQETTGIIRHSYMSLESDEQMALAALASIADDGRPFVGLEDIAETLHHDQVPVSKRDLFDTLRQLVDRDFIVERRGEGTDRQYGFAMDLVRVWLEQNDEYTRLVEEVRDESKA